MKAVELPHVIHLFQIMETPGNVYIVIQHAGWGQLLAHIQAGGCGPAGGGDLEAVQAGLELPYYCPKEGIGTPRPEGREHPGGCWRQR